MINAGLLTGKVIGLMENIPVHINYFHAYQEVSFG